MNLKGISLFSNIGVAEAYFKELGVNVCLANELIDRRAKLYSQIYPDTEVVSGDFTNKVIYDNLLAKSKQYKVDFIMATPPCQGMSTAGRQEKYDKRNDLIIPTLKFIKELKPKYILIENVPQFLSTTVIYDNEEVNILDLIKNELCSDFKINSSIIDTKYYSVPQSRKRAIILMTRNDVKKEWFLPVKQPNILTLYDAIGNLPPLDPYIKDVSKKELLDIFPEYFTKKENALKISKWHKPPVHVKRQVIAMMHTPTGKSAFENDYYKPIKENGELVKGYKNTYKRQKWDSPGYAVTMDNRKISSQDNVHPGRPINSSSGKLFSDPRTLSLYEIMRVMSLPDDWPIPSKTSEAFIRRIIGEGIPPRFVKLLFENIL
jgi:DNA (cytosine-5)-methyltransferase 1